VSAPLTRPDRSLDQSGRRPISRALLSVYDKTGLPELARGLHANGVRLVSTGSTAEAVEAAGVPVTRVEELTGFPEALGGRVKTLHPAIHAGLLADAANRDHRRQLAELGIEPFDLLVSNLYPFSEAVGSGADPAECVEQIDIGGPAMIRAAAKNCGTVAVVVTPQRYADVLAAVAAGGFDESARRTMAADAFAHTAAYDVAVASWFAERDESPGSPWPRFLGRTYRLAGPLRYGENPHQPAALYTEDGAQAELSQAALLSGKSMSFNNYLDAEAARWAVANFAEPCVAIMKHVNPCGIAVGPDLADAHRKALACDPVSAFGGVIATNRPVTVALADQIAAVFTEVVCAPEFEPTALDRLRTRKSLRLVRCPVPDPRSTGLEGRPIGGGLLVQQRDAVDAAGDDPARWVLAAGAAADDDTMRDLDFAWRAVRSVKSNAILLAAGGASVGIGMGQVNRVDAVRLALARAGDRAKGSVAASDAFFPFADGLQALIDGGVRAVVQPGGSVRDAEVIEAAQAAGLTMYVTGTRHFLH
jgi:phosphoribosylaminoimidazolecarboxamide formyltransferase / IMP cyclohydrolase